jgi:RsiW-degrading membrane proteinase PrsW (M82 family)
LNTPAFLAALAVGPGFLLLHILYALDRHEKEPVLNLIRYVLIGALVGLLAGLVGQQLRRLPFWSGDLSPLMFGLWIFLGIALLEEGAKRLGLELLIRRDPHVNEPFDWIVYSVAVALGFATLENLLYVLPGGAGTGFVRALTAVPAHALNGTLMGHRLALAQLEPERARRHRWLAVLEPTAWHGSYDALALGAARAAEAGSLVVAVFLMVGFVCLVPAMWIVGVRRLRALQRVRPERLLPPLLYPTLWARRRGHR